MMYIGYTNTDVEERWKHHVRDAFSDSHLKFHVAIREQGTRDWDHEKICDDILTLKDAKVLERHFIEMMGTWENGYNMTKGGDGSGPKDETARLKMRTAKLGTKQSTTTVQKRVQKLLGRPGPMRGKHHSEETRAKTSAALVGRKKVPFTEKHRQNISMAKRGSVPWNKLTTENEEQIKAVNETTLDNLHAHIIKMVREGFTFEDIVKQSGRNYRTTRNAILRALKKEQIQLLPSDFYKRGPYQKENR